MHGRPCGQAATSPGSVRNNIKLIGYLLRRGYEKHSTGGLAEIVPTECVKAGYVLQVNEDEEEEVIDKCSIC